MARAREWEPKRCPGGEVRLVYNKRFAPILRSDKKMIRFLQTQGPTKKIVLSGILLVICGAMVITFIPGGLTSELTGTPGKGIIAKVDGADLSADEKNTTGRQMAQAYALCYGEMASKLMPFIMQQETGRAVEQLISRQALLSEAKRMGLRVSPEEVKDELQH